MQRLGAEGVSKDCRDFICLANEELRSFHFARVSQVCCVSRHAAGCAGLTTVWSLMSGTGAPRSRHQTGAGAGTWRPFVGRGGGAAQIAPGAGAACGCPPRGVGRRRWCQARGLLSTGEAAGTFDLTGAPRACC